MLSLPKVEMITPSPSTAHYGTRLIICILLLSISFFVSCGVSQTPSAAVAEAFERHQSNVRVEGEGVVSKILPDDAEGMRHQRFILRLSSGQTVLIAQNTDIAPRVEDLKTGDTVTFAGEYVWNEQGGLVHWTHHDPAGTHPTGWLKYNGRTYQ